MHSQTGIGIPRTYQDFGKVQGKLNALRWQRLKVTAASCIFMLRDIRGIVWQAALWVHRERSCLCRT